jgi:hypothetical protein
MSEKIIEQLDITWHGPEKVKYRVAFDKMKPEEGNYYDLIRVPHGHVPAPKVKLWGGYAVPIKEVRDECTFHCLRCGEPNFFKVHYCNECVEYGENVVVEVDETREKIRRIIKDAEAALLPLLVLLGVAWYMPSVRTRSCERVIVQRIFVPGPQSEFDRPVTVHGPLDKYLGEAMP